jgi:hypothetical protein
MGLNIKSLLTNKNVLRLISVLALVNLMGYVMVKNMNAVTLFAAVGLLMTYFNKNMIIVLLTTMIATNLYVVFMKNYTEGFGGKGASRKNTRKMRDNRVMPASESLDQEMSTGTGGLDTGATIDKTYENLENILGSKTIQHMGKDTQKLVKRQQKLQEQITNLQPALSKSMDLLNQMGGPNGIEGMISNVNNMLTKFSGVTNSILPKS